MRPLTILLLTGFTILLANRAEAEAPSIQLAAEGKVLLPVVVSAKATDRTKQAARTLADYLGRIAQTKVEVKTGEGNTGIAVGILGDFPTLLLPKVWEIADPTRREDFLLRSHAQGLYLIGATELAVEHAVWDLLYRLGHRQFFPGPTWEVIPSQRDLAIRVDSLERPDYHSRRIWYGYGAPSWSKQHYAEWCARNRATGGIDLHTGHAYDGILNRNRKTFEQHPEYLGLLNGKRTSTKFCISNPGLRKLVADDALAMFAKEPERQSVSVDPSDGGGWCECDQCKALGSISDRALRLANHVAESVEAKYPGKFIGMYAYSQHSPPPSIRVHPRVIISVATGFITGGYSVDQLMQGWQKQGATLGVREYYSVHTWDRDLPGKARGANTAYIASTIPHFHKMGTRFFSAESSDNWGCNGLGYYLASRLLWNTREAERIEELKADFFQKAFGPARETMAEFYRLTDASGRPLLTDDLVGRMYRLLDKALQQTQDPAIRTRLHDLVGYTRYVELWLDYSSAAGDERQKAFETLIRHAYRCRHSLMVHTLGLARDLPSRDKTIQLPSEVRVLVGEAKNPWMKEGRYSAEEFTAILSRGIAERKLFDFQPVAFSENLVPATRLNLPAVTLGSAGIYSRGVRTYWTWLDKTPGKISLEASAGLIYGNRGEAHVALYPLAETEGKAVAEVGLAPDKMKRPVTLASTFAGLHRIQVSDHGAGTNVTWPEGTPMTLLASSEHPETLHGRWSLYFYVPRGTKTIGGYAGGPGSLLDSTGKTALKFSNKAGFFSVPVPEGQDGKLWKFHQSAGLRLLMTVPPCLARSEKELLLPAEVVERDSRK